MKKQNILKFSKIILFLSLLLLAITGNTKGEVKDKITETLKPSGTHEDCMELLSGQTLYYSFETSKKVKFNLHYHEKGGMFYPISKDDISMDQGTFYVKKQEY